MMSSIVPSASFKEDNMYWISAVILGVVQGLTEFLPISSSAHLIVIPWLIGWSQEGLAFDVALHIGTSISVLVFFRNDWIRLAQETLRGLKEKRPLANPDRKLAWLLILATIPAAVSGLIFEDYIEQQLRSPLITVFTLTFFAILLYWAERKSRKNRSIESFSFRDAVWIGISQAVALIPGVSRSGITMTAAMALNSDRESAARFSFLLSTPVIVGAGVLESCRYIKTLQHPVSGSMGNDWLLFIVGIFVSSVTGFFCIRYFLRFIQTKTFTPFVIYRIVLACIILIYYINF